MQQELPHFFPEEKTDVGYEAMQDFFLSWTLRCSVYEVKDVNLRLYNYALKIVYALVFGKNEPDKAYAYTVEQPIPSDFRVHSVQAIRQENQIDLLVELKIFINGKMEQYILNIENKWYTSIRSGQLAKAKNYVLAKYGDTARIRHLVIFCDYEKIDVNRDEALSEGYSILSIEDLKDFAGIQENKHKWKVTGNYMFDEYWFKL